MCFGSLLTLENSRTLHNSTLSPTTPPLSQEFLQRSLHGINTICARFIARLEQVNSTAISPFPPHSLYLAVKAEEKRGRETRDPTCEERAEMLRGMLVFFGKRWRSGGKFFVVLLVMELRIGEGWLIMCREVFGYA